MSVRLCELVGEWRKRVSVIVGVLGGESRCKGESTGECNECGCGVDVVWMW